MIRITSKINVGDLADCMYGLKDESVVHACKDPCHRQAVGYKANLPRNHKYYVSYKLGENLYLNMIDPALPLFKIELFQEFLKFSTIQLEKGNSLLIHCNQGLSRSPSLALVLMAKRLNLLSNESYDKASERFMEYYSIYNPSKGIKVWLTEHWNQL